MKQQFEQLHKDSSVAWHRLYAKERAKREEVEAKYELLTTQIRELTLEKKNKVGEFGELGPMWDDERTDIIGQNGNDGLHYNRLEAYCEELYDDDLDKEGM
jgi:hypothetical protein